MTTICLDMKSGHANFWTHEERTKNIERTKVWTYERNENLLIAQKSTWTRESLDVATIECTKSAQKFWTHENLDIRGCLLFWTVWHTHVRLGHFGHADSSDSANKIWYKLIDRRLISSKFYHYKQNSIYQFFNYNFSLDRQLYNFNDRYDSTECVVWVGKRKWGAD